jgi:hypothetical protein
MLTLSRAVRVSRLAAGTEGHTAAFVVLDSDVETNAASSA